MQRRLVVALLACAGLLPSCSPAEPPENLLFVSIDTLRADHLSAYGYERQTSPNIEAFAEDAVLFEDVYSHNPSTVPSFASIMTSKYPHHHGVTETYHFALSATEITLAERLERAGLETAAILGIGILMPNRRLDQGFRRYEVAPIRGTETWWTAAEVTSRAIAWLEQQDAPFFLWVHYFEPHVPHEIVPPTFLERFMSSPAPRSLEHLRDQPQRLAHRKYVVDKYDGAIAWVDSEVGRLLRRVDELGLTERTMIVLTSDHGESLGAHDLYGHLYQIYEPLVRVPLIVRVPGLAPARVATPVEHVDVSPTVLARFGLEDVEGGDGKPLPLAGQTGEAKDVFAETWVVDAGRRAAIRSGRWKLIVNDPRYEADERSFVRAPPIELYDLETDPRELVNVADVEAERRDALRQRLDAWMTDSMAKPIPIGLRPGELEMLRTLGYVE